MGATQCTISTHNGSAAHRDHNIRNEKVVSKEAHIQENGHYEIWKDETPRQAYHKLFDQAVERYNAKQTREDRKITNYYSQIEKDAKKHPVYEMIIGVYPEKGKFIDEDTQKAILKEFVDNWQVRNPNLYMCGAYFHADEEGEPHVHIDYIPVARGYSKGMDTQTGLVKALEQQGITKEGRETAQIKWERSENEYLTKLCEARGLEVQHPTNKSKEHLHTEIYKAQMTLESAIDNTKGLLDIQDDIRLETSRLKLSRDIAEKQAEKAIERKERALKRSFKKDKASGWTYNKNLENEIKDLVKERSKDVAAIGHTNLDIEREYSIAAELKNRTEIEYKSRIEQANKELERAEQLKQDELDHINRSAQQQAQQLLNQFIREQELNKSDRCKRLEQYCEDITFKDGSSVMDRFNQEEEKRAEQLLQKLKSKSHHRSHSWDYEH